MKNTIKLIGIIALVTVIGISTIACNNGSSGGGGNTNTGGGGSKGEFYAESLSLSISGSIRINFYTYALNSNYDGTIENIKQEFTVTIDGKKVEIIDFVCHPDGLNGGSFHLLPDGEYGSSDGFGGGKDVNVEHDVKVTYKASSPNRLYIVYDGKKYFINSFELTKKDTFSHWII